MSDFKDVTTRFFADSERRLGFNEKSLPLIIETTTKNLRLKDFITKNQEEILVKIQEYGGVLLRGFDVENATEFESSILSIKKLSAIKNIFMSEPGRVHVNNLQFVFDTNSFVKTGGGVQFQRFHVENYSTTDVPRYIAFFCFQEPKFGGETGLINLTNLYKFLSPPLQEKLERLFC